tara:strand:+ start:474 stop:758 length:285 start_codon:yes stop_codon:yes gene_type:complete
MNVNILQTTKAREITKSNLGYSESEITLNSGQKIKAKRVLDRTDGGLEITAKEGSFIVIDKENIEKVEYSKSVAKEINAKIQPPKRGGGCCGKR